MSFYDVIQTHPRGEIEREIRRRSRGDVERALAARLPGLDGLMSLLSPAAEPFLEEMAQRAHRLTLQRFGRVMGMFAPLYLSNVCTNRCVYCGFNVGNGVSRVTLTPDESASEGELLHRMGFRSVLLLTGEAPHIITAQYLERVLARLRQDDLPLAAARKIAPGLLIGVSAHSREEALQAGDEAADYVNIGPIFPTRTKEGVSRFLGPEAIPAIAAGLTIPFTVMGGINGANIESVLAQGARRVAVVTAVTQAPDMAGAVAALRERIKVAGT